MKFLLSPLILFLYSSVLFAQTSLQYNLKQGEVFTVKQDAVQIITQELEGAAHEITNVINGILEFKVVALAKDSYEIELRFKDLNLSMTSSIQGELMNVKASEVIEGDMQSKIFNSLLNSPVMLTLARTGDILQVIGGDSLVSKMADASGIEDEFSLNLMKKSLEKEFGSEALSNSYKQMTYIYPDEPVSVGSTWENSYTGKLNTKNSWALDEITAAQAMISGKAEVVMDIKEPATTMLLNGTQQTKITANLDSGFIQKMEVEGLSEGFSTITQLGEQEIPTKIKSTITYELIEE
ncbi:DUF6263 family protein [Spongiimicrobium sp. 3-5]|uniref:DUF6263 family protein n=1 Tax=Spongiimicrobium sp. 3-5 TaxID=3332596 RepID=UPI003980D62C